MGWMNDGELVDMRLMEGLECFGDLAFVMSANIVSRMLQLLVYQLYISTWGSYKLGFDSVVCTSKSDGPAYCHYLAGERLLGFQDIILWS